jgi:hypothetical protein
MYSGICAWENAKGLIAVGRIQDMLGRGRRSELLAAMQSHAHGGFLETKDFINRKKLTPSMFARLVEHADPSRALNMLFHSLETGTPKPTIGIETVARVLNMETQAFTGSLPWQTPAEHSMHDAEAVVGYYEKEKRLVETGRLSWQGFRRFMLGAHAEAVMPHHRTAYQDLVRGFPSSFPSLCSVDHRTPSHRVPDLVRGFFLLLSLLFGRSITEVGTHPVAHVLFSFCRTHRCQATSSPRRTTRTWWVGS